MEFPDHDDTPEDEESQAEARVDSNSQQRNQELARWMVMFVYDRLAIDRDARTLAFWEEFRVLHCDVAMSAHELRDFFYHEVMETVTYLENLPYHVRQYINPMFNRYRREVLQQQDTLVLGYSNQSGRKLVSATPSKLPIELLLEPPSRSLPSPAPVASNGLPNAQQVLRFVSDNISELLTTKEEKAANKTTLSTTEMLKRMAVLTQNGISMAQCAEPGMKCYNRMRQLGLLPEDDDGGVTIEAQDKVATPDEGRHGISSSSDLEDFRTPVDMSTPFVSRSKMAVGQKDGPKTGTVPLANSRYDLRSSQGKESAQRLAREDRLRAMQNDDQQPCCSYRK